MGPDQDKKEFGMLFPLFYGSQEERNYAKGIKVIKKLAENGYVPAICELGIAYFDHLGVHRNYKESFRFYMEAALQGYPSAEAAVGNFYSMAFPKHEACELDAVKSVEWYIRASDNGNSGAQYNLAEHYLSGAGIKKDPVEAYVWASLAVHCSVIGCRPGEVCRDQALAMISEMEKKSADQRIEELKKHLPYEWSEHMMYWQKLYKNL